MLSSYADRLSFKVLGGGFSSASGGCCTDESHVVAQPTGFCGAVRECVPQMAIRVSGTHLDPIDEVAAVAPFNKAVRVDGLGEAGPATSAVEFVHRGEKRSSVPFSWVTWYCSGLSASTAAGFLRYWCDTWSPSFAQTLW